MGSKYIRGTDKRRKEKTTIKAMTEWIVPRVYAAIICELWDRGWTVEQIQELITGSQERWIDSVQNNWDILANVQEVTGIEIKYFYKTGNIV